MEESSLLDLLVPFLTFVFIIGSAIFKSSNEKKSDDHKQSRTNRPTQSTAQRTQSQTRQTRLERFEIDESELKNQKDEQLNQLKKDLSISTKASVAKQTPKHDLGETLKSKSKRRAISRKEMNFESYFTKKGLAGSVVMAEVLGNPRAKKPYHPYDR